MNLVNKFCYVSYLFCDVRSSKINARTGKGMAESILDSVGNCTTTNVVLAIIRGFKIFTNVTIYMISFIVLM